MATLLHSKSRRLHSRWGDCHASLKNSKWLQENLKEMDSKVKAMIELIEEDGDSFARRAEMYYKKLPELIKLVEEFYQTFHALAERYNHTTVAESFPDRVNSDPEKPNPIRTLSEPNMRRITKFLDESDRGRNNRGLKQLSELFGSERPPEKVVVEQNMDCQDSLLNGFSPLLSESQNLQNRINPQCYSCCKTETEVESLRKSLMEIEDQSEKSDVEIKILKEAICKLETHQDVAVLRYSESLEKINGLETCLYLAQEDVKGLNKCAHKAEELEEELDRLQIENELVVLQWQEIVSALQIKIMDSERNAQSLKDRTERAEAEIAALQEEVYKLKEEKESASFLYEQILATLTESESSNFSLTLEADNLEKKMGIKDAELLENQNELVKLQVSLQNESLRFTQVEARLITLQELHFQSENKQRDLTAELENRLQRLNELNKTLKDEVYSYTEMKKKLEEEITLQVGRSSTLQEEVDCLKEELKSMNKRHQMMTQNHGDLLERSLVLENSLYDANIEVEWLRANSKSSEEFYQVVKSQNFDLLKERNNLLSQLENTKRKLFDAESKYSRSDIEKESAILRVEELKGLLVVEKQERDSYVRLNETRLADLQNLVHLLEEECRSRTKQLEEEKDEALKSQVEVITLQTFVQDLEHKNLSLLIESQNQAKALKVAEILISKLEAGNLDQQMESKLLLNEIKYLREGIYRVFMSLQFDSAGNKVDNFSRDKNCIARVLSDIDELKGLLSRYEDEKSRLTVENSVILSFLQQLRYTGIELEAETKLNDINLKILIEQNSMLQKEKQELLKTNRQWESEVVKGNEQVKALKADLCLQNENMKSLELMNTDLKKNLETLTAKLYVEEEESRGLYSKGEKLQKEIDEMKDLNSELKFQSLIGQELLRSKTAALQEMSKVDDERKREWEESKTAQIRQKEEIVQLFELNKNLQYEIEEQKVKQECLLLENTNDLKLWDAEASSFYFDLQASGFREILLENKVKELTRICERLEDESVALHVEANNTKEKVSTLESELTAYNSIISSLRDCIESLEQSTFEQRKIQVKVHQEMGPEEHKPYRDMDGLSHLQELQPRLKSIENELKAKGGLPIKDIPLDQVSNSSFDKATKKEISRLDDQMLQLWETTEESIINESNSPMEISIDKVEVTSFNNLYRMPSDDNKLTNLRENVEDLRTKMDKKTKERNDCKEKTSFLRRFISGSRRNSGNLTKARFCGCMRPTTTDEK